MTTELEALRKKVAKAVARMDAATPGPWYAIGGEAGWVVTLSLNNPIARLKNWLKPNAEFIAAHPTDIKTMQELMAKVEALEAENQALKADVDSYSDETSRLATEVVGLQADKAKLREALVEVKCGPDRWMATIAAEALKETSDE